MQSCGRCMCLSATCIKFESQLMTLQLRLPSLQGLYWCSMADAKHLALWWWAELGVFATAIGNHLVRRQLPVPCCGRS